MNGAELAFSQVGETVQRTMRTMFQPGNSQDAPVDFGDAGRKPKPTPAAPAVDAHLRAGAKLTQARELKGLSLDEIAKDIHVRRDFLEALEAMNVKLLPGKAYALAFLKSYAKALGLDADAIVAQFKAESALTREDAQPQLRNPESKPGRERPWLGALAIAAIVAAFVGWRAWDTRAADPRLQIAGSAAASAVAAGDESPTAIEAAPAVVVEIKALREGWLEVRGPDGTIFLSRVLRAGDRYRPETGAGWTLHAKDGGAFDVSVDGATIGALGHAGAPVLGRRVDTLATSVSVVAAKPAPAAKKPAPPAEPFVPAAVMRPGAEPSEPPAGF